MTDLVLLVPSEQFYALHDWDSPEVHKFQRQAQCLSWDPWPVKHTVSNHVFSAAQNLVRIHNARCITCSQKITLLPASGNNVHQQGGSVDRGLYSLRSPSALPVKMHIWQTPGAKIMASKGLQTAPLTGILASFGNLKKTNIRACDICKHYRCWKSRSISKQWLECVPTRLHRTVHERWWSFNGFPFLRLPFELREMVTRVVIGPYAEPWKRDFRTAYPRRPSYATQQSRKSNMSLAGVNKQLYSEVMTTFSLYTTLLLWNGEQMGRFFDRVSVGIMESSSFCKNVRHIELDLGPTQLRQLFHVPRDVRAGDSAKSCYDRLGTRFQMWVNKRHLRRFLINFPHVSHCWRDWECDLTICQKTFCLRVWAGVRVVLRDVPTIEMGGHIDDKQKQEWLQDLSLERKGVVADPEGLRGWQKNIWAQ